MEKIRVLVVDDSAVMRRILCDALSSDPAIEVMGPASDGRSALALIEQVAPHVVILDIEMPKMDGLETLKVMRERCPKLPVIICSTPTVRGASATIEALTLGAGDYVTNDSGATSAMVAIARIRQQLLAKIKALCGFPIPWPSARNPRSNPMGLLPPRPPSPVEIVAIGTATGGPHALSEVLKQFPADLPVPVLIVQHLPPVFTRLLAERLSVLSHLPVREAVADAQLLPGQVWIAPGDYHLGLYRDGTRIRLMVHQTPPENSCRPSVDVLFSSVAEVFGGNSLAVVMTGIGQDGLAGAKRLRQAGGQVLAQDEATSVVRGMPGFIANAGLADAILPLSQIGAEVVRRVVDSRRNNEWPLAPTSLSGRDEPRRMT